MHPTFAIVSPTGDVVELGTSADSASPFVLDDSTTGMGFVAREVQVTPSTGDGGRFRATRVASRPATLVVAVWGATVDERTANLQRLSAAVRRLKGYPLPRLQATMPDGTVYELPFVHEGGGDSIKRVVLAGPQVVPFDVICPDPFWTARDATPFAIQGLQSTGTFLPKLAQMHLTSSAAQGVLEVVNDGDGEAQPVWRLTGPTPRATITLGADTWALGPVAANEVITVDTRAKTATLVDGTNVYDRLSTAPRLFAIPPGTHRINITMPEAAPSTSATLYFRKRLEVIL